ncbi:polysaccharide pyruvyl transferase family protein [Paraglaciecola sp.]|uniref:polysaccharide pyruvyl transferase family protein n=1 Tax=Paraglaciecola sp. TaxID=1920173 RepID=UPI003EF59A43
MKSIVVYGAFDRYNYGDNLMPILFELFIEKYYPSIIDSHELVFASLSESDLTQFSVKKTSSISRTILDNKLDIAAIIVIGGEVLEARSRILFAHMKHPFGINTLMKVIGKLSTKLADKLAKIPYPVPWEFPFIPEHNALTADTKIAYNTVGGDIRTLKPSDMNVISEHMNSACYVSARDSRTVDGLNQVTRTKEYPDSVCAVSDLINQEFLEKNTRNKVFSQLNEDYICFQAAPHKVGAGAEKTAKVLEEISTKLNLKVILLPIGYAAGHDDINLLKEIHNYNKSLFSLHYGLNVWEIMRVIKQSRLFMGTSLHGCITGLSFGVCSVAINPNILKLNHFMQRWASPTIDRSYSIESLPKHIDEIMAVEKSELNENAKKLSSLALKNNNELILSLNLHKKHKK